MNIHKNTRLTPHNRQTIWRAYTQNKQSITSLAAEYKVGRPTIYRILKAARNLCKTPAKESAETPHVMFRLIFSPIG